MWAGGNPRMDSFFSVRRRFEVRKSWTGLAEVLSDWWDDSVHLPFLDLSPRGAFLRTDYPLEIGERLVLDFGVPGADRRFLTSGLVQYVNLGRRKMDREDAGMGITFEDVPPLA